MARLARALRRGLLFVVVVTAALVLITCVRSTWSLGRGGASLEVWPAGGSARFVDRVVDERIAATFGAWLLPRLGLLSARESPHLASEMWSAYGELAARTGVQPSPAPATWLGLEGADAFDTVVLAPPHARAPPRTAVLILHGFGGNFTLSCWLLARGALDAGMLAVCPSMGPSGAWWTDDGERIVRRTLTTLARRGVERVYLAGLSNGGVGASLLAPRLVARPEPHTPELAGLVLVSGVAPSGATGGLPALVVQGDRDTMVPRDGPRTFAAAQGATYREVQGGHFVLLERRAELARLIERWLVAQGASPRTRSP